MTNNLIFQYTALAIIFILVIIYIIIKVNKNRNSRKQGNMTCPGCALKDCCSATGKENKKKGTQDIANPKK